MSITCTVPTLFAGASLVTAATLEPPRATRSATAEITIAGEGRKRMIVRILSLLSVRVVVQEVRTENERVAFTPL